MRLGATLVHLADAPPYAVAPWAQRLVAAGFESLWTPHIVGRGLLVPDPFTTLAVAAAVTQDVELGTATVQLPLLHPADLAHRVLSLMSVCGDRLTLGVSPGSTEADYVTLDREYAARFGTFRLHADRLRVLLTDGRDEHADLAPPPSADGRRSCSGRGAPTSSARPGTSTAGLRLPQHVNGPTRRHGGPLSRGGAAPRRVG